MFCSDEAAPHPRPLLGSMSKENRAEVLKRFSSVLLEQCLSARQQTQTLLLSAKPKDTGIDVALKSK